VNDNWIWKEEVVVYFTFLSRHSPGEIEENQEIFSQDSWSPGRDLHPEPPEYEAGL
jgi:hypothetical protein